MNFGVKFQENEKKFDTSFKSVNVVQVPGKDGEDGFSPIVETTETDNGHQITITDVNGEHSFEVLNGKDGIDGRDGEQGPKGEQGEIGSQGPQGLQGPKGEVGPKGDKGDIGPQGEQGIQGPKGDKGDKGDIGPEGPTGPKGDTGEKGEKGDKGDKGEQGPIGLTGPEGPAGKDGKDGERGPQGPRGEQGPQGEDGYTPQKGIDYFTEEDLAFINPKVQIHNVAELPQTLNERSLYDLYRLSKYKGVYAVKANGSAEAQPVWGFVYFVDELPEVGEPSVFDGDIPLGDVHLYWHLTKENSYWYDINAGWVELGAFPMFFSEENFLSSDFDECLLIQGGDSRIFSVDAKSVESYSDPSIPISYVELTNGSEIHNVSELPTTAKDGLYKIAIHKGGIASLHSNIPEGVFVSETPVFVYFVDELPEVGLTTDFNATLDGPDVYHLYVKLPEGQPYLYFGGWGRAYWPLFYSKSEYKESGYARQCILIDSVEEKLYSAKDNTFTLFGTVPYLQKSEALATYEKQYELWNDITMTEDAAQISLNKKDNGELYGSFSKMKIAIFGKLTPDVATRLRATMIEPSGNQYFLWGGSTTYTYDDDVKGYAWYATLERISNAMFRCEVATKFVNNKSVDTTAAPQFYAVYNRKQPADYYFNPSGFNVFTAETPTKFLAGTNIKVWGVK